LTGHEGLTDLVNEPAATRAIRARKLFRPGTVADLYVLPPGLNHEETAEAVGPSPTIVFMVALYTLQGHGLLFRAPTIGSRFAVPRRPPDCTTRTPWVAGPDATYNRGCGGVYAGNRHGRLLISAAAGVPAATTRTVCGGRQRGIIPWPAAGRP
ncbi:MAG: hypothetical protein LBV60_17160, partial [Streptomyces sp.]|nr:hypothetical protein [Streptomyces sp.]